MFFAQPALVVVTGTGTARNFIRLLPVHNENSIQRFPVKRHIVTSRSPLTQPAVPFRMSLISMAFVPDGICGIRLSCLERLPLSQEVACVAKTLPHPAFLCAMKPVRHSR